MIRAGSRHDQSRIAALCRWFMSPGVARQFPWRTKRTPWSALVAEIMLQQTQAARVAERFELFMKRFPTPARMAGTPLQKVLHLWQGLGYYRRARHLHAAARMIVAQQRGKVPDQVDLLRELPGVGRYTAGAVASIAFGRAAPIVDGNVRRVLARWHAHRAEPGNGSMDSWAWAAAKRHVQLAIRPAVFNEAMMELGATICTPRNPRCDVCPVARFCAAHRLGLAAEFPTPVAAPVPSAWHHHSLIILRGGKLLMEQRPDSGMWAGMWQTPTIESPRALRPGELAQRLPFAVQGLKKIAGFPHLTTHRRITFHVYRGSTRARPRGGTWSGPLDLARLPMSNPQRRIVKLLLHNWERYSAGQSD